MLLIAPSSTLRLCVPHAPHSKLPRPPLPPPPPPSVQAFLLTAMKFHGYVCAMPRGPQRDPRLVLRALQACVSYLTSLAASRARAAQARLGLPCRWVDGGRPCHVDRLGLGLPHRWVDGGRPCHVGRLGLGLPHRWVDGERPCHVGMLGLGLPCRWVDGGRPCHVGMLGLGLPWCLWGGGSLDPINIAPPCCIAQIP